MGRNTEMREGGEGQRHSEIKLLDSDAFKQKMKSTPIKLRNFVQKAFLQWVSSRYWHCSEKPTQVSNTAHTFGSSQHTAALFSRSCLGWQLPLTGNFGWHLVAGMKCVQHRRTTKN